MKANIQRIQFFTRKAAQYSRQYPRKAQRFERLIAYKAELNRRLEAEKLRWKPAVVLSDDGGDNECKITI